MDSKPVQKANPPKPAEKKFKKHKSAKPFAKRDERSKKPLLDPKAGKLIAVTGGIGTGKSFTLAVFEQEGFAVFDADKAIHQMLKREGAAFAEVAALFPDCITDEGIDRKALGQMIFHHPEKLKQLEAILHPKVRQAQLDFVINERKNKARTIVIEVPLLFENNRQSSFDAIVVTISPKEVQKERTLTRNNMTEEKFDAIIKRQVSDNVRLKGADYIIKTGRTKEDTIRQVRAIIKNDRITRDSTRHRNNRPLRPRRRQDH